MKSFPTAIPEVILLEPRVFVDPRGFFMETYRADQAVAPGFRADFMQDNHSGSRKHVLRGLHYQVRQPQGKLVRAVTGEIFDVAVDLRRSSPFFGKWVGEIISADNKAILWIPPGFAHGFLVLSEWADVIYKTTAYYAPEWERTLIWNDATVGIRWPIPAGGNPHLSAKDASGACLEEAEVYD
jgi:dTDP-4-dehydrorhamnose 3,5-epimerase